MKRTLLTGLALLVPVLVLAGEQVRVKVQKGAIYEEPQFFSAVLAAVRYEDALEMTGETEGWARVRYLGKEGWIHKSCLTSAKVDLGNVFFSGSSSSTTEDEVALAGKGFTPEVENGYRRSHPDANYLLVDKIERYSVSQERLWEFIEEGGLNMRRDGR